MSENMHKRKNRVSVGRHKKRKLNLVDFKTNDKLETELLPGRSTVKDYPCQFSDNSNVSKMCNDTSVSLKRKKRISPNLKLKNALWIWYTQQRSAGLIQTNTTLKKQAILFAKSFGSSTHISDNWLNKWKEKHGIPNLPERTTERFAMDKCNSVFMRIVKNKNLTQDQMFTCCESTFSYKSLPLPANSETSHAINDTRVTFFTCSNASGSFKLPLVIIGSSIVPETMHGPIRWIEHPHSWLTIDIFNKWFREDFVPLVSQFLKNKGLPNKAWLIADSCYEQPKSIREGDIKATLLSSFMLPVTKIIDENSVDYLKKLYRQKLMLNILDNCKTRGNVENYVKSIELKDCIYWLSEAWREIPPHVIQYWWQPLWETELTDDNLSFESYALKEETNDTEINDHITFETCTPAFKFEIHEAGDDSDVRKVSECINGKALKTHTEVETQALIALMDRFLEVLRTQIDSCQQLKRSDIRDWLNEATRVDNENVNTQDIVSFVTSCQDLQDDSDSTASEESDESIVHTDSASVVSDSDDVEDFEHSRRKRRRTKNMESKHRRCFEKIKYLKAAYKREKLLRVAAEDALSSYQTAASQFTPSVFEALNEIKYKLDQLADKEKEKQKPAASALTVSITNPVPKLTEDAASSWMLDNVEVQNDYVHLGEDCWCPVSSWLSMCQANNGNRWAISLLKGVFGENAKYYRMKPRKPGLQPFPPNFLSIAQAHYRIYLARKDIPRDEIERRLKKLPALLADRALDMNGRRQKRPGVDAQMSIFNAAINRERDLQLTNDNRAIMLNEVTGEIMNVDTMDTVTLAKRLGADGELHESQSLESDYGAEETRSSYSKNRRMSERDDFDT